MGSCDSWLVENRNDLTEEMLPDAADCLPGTPQRIISNQRLLELGYHTLSQAIPLFAKAWGTSVIVREYTGQLNNIYGSKLVLLEFLLDFYKGIKLIFSSLLGRYVKYIKTSVILCFLVINFYYSK